MQNSSYKKGEFTYKQDLRLKRCVKEYGMHNWDKVAQKMKHFTAQECEARYNHIINGDLVKRPWTLEEDRTIKKMVETYGTRWHYFIHCFSDRSINDIKNRYYRYVRNRDLDFQEEPHTPPEPKPQELRLEDCLVLSRFKIENLLI